MTGVTGIAVAAVALGAGLALLMTPAPRIAPTGDERGHRSRRPRLVVSSALSAAVVLAVASPTVTVLALLTLAVGAAAGRTLAVRRRDRAAAQVRRGVVDLCDALQAELVAGQSAGAALDRAAADWPFVAPAARAAATGGDVVAALRVLARTPGGEALRVVAGAWQVAHRTGHGLADTLGRVATELRAAERTRRIVAGELASARATARLLAALPLLALAMGAGAGAAPWAFLLGHPAGLACLAGGLAAGYAGLAWIEALARDVERHG